MLFYDRNVIGKARAKSDYEKAKSLWDRFVASGSEDTTEKTRLL